MKKIYHKLEQVIAGNDIKDIHNKLKGRGLEQDEYKAYELYGMILQSNKSIIKALFDKTQKLV